MSSLAPVQSWQFPCSEDLHPNLVHKGEHMIVLLVTVLVLRILICILKVLVCIVEVMV